MVVVVSVRLIIISFNAREIFFPRLNKDHLHISHIDQVHSKLALQFQNAGAPRCSSPREAGAPA